MGASADQLGETKYFCSVGRTRGTPLDDGVPMCNSG